ncbi:MAG TPA: glycyl-radical enzyme activating protein, partial [Spirochaetota bacterium]|nr:glycyl-radical enzyme activating protein [Spirochaetota bacterium]
MNGNPLVLEIKGNSLDDGPGIRSVVFFKGCPLSCVWCHNPESQGAAAELSFDGEKCIRCGTCSFLCGLGALSETNPGFVDRGKCDRCFACVQECPSGALSLMGTAMTPEEIAARVLCDKPFYDTSGGGVTLSGGEPTLFMNFTSRLLQILKAEGVHTLVETCGFFQYDNFSAAILPYTDTVFYDLKIFDEGAHKKYCGVPNGTILENFVKLADTARSGGPELLPRVPLVPGITDTPENLRAIAAFLREHSIDEARLLSYNPLWRAKT